MLKDQDIINGKVIYAKRILKLKERIEETTKIIEKIETCLKKFRNRKENEDDNFFKIDLEFLDENHGRINILYNIKLDKDNILIVYIILNEYKKIRQIAKKELKELKW